MLAGIYEAVNKVVTGVRLSLVPYREENGGSLTWNIPIARRFNRLGWPKELPAAMTLSWEQRRQCDGATVFTNNESQYCDHSPSKERDAAAARRAACGRDAGRIFDRDSLRFCETAEPFAKSTRIALHDSDLR